MQNSDLRPASRNHLIHPRHTSVAGIKARIRSLAALLLGATTLCGIASAQSSGTYQVTNIISDGSVPALVTDPNFINPWGISIGSDFWINTNATGFDYVALTSGTIPFKVVVPAAAGGTTTTGTPTGTVFYSGNGFVLPNGSPAIFLFAALDGTLSGWNAALGTANSVAQITVNNNAAGAVYTDMAILTNPSGTFLLAANFGAGTDIEVYDTTFKAAKLAGSFTDPTLPANYAPYSVHTIGSQVFVTYALRTVTSSTSPTPTPAPYVSPRATSYAPTVGPSNGIVDVFDTTGNFVARAVTGGNLNTPWGVAIAPAAFGIYGGDLLIGNFGDGIINVYDPKSFAYLGQLTDGTGKAISYPGLWEIVFGTGSNGYGDVDSLYFTAGLGNETHGLFGAIANTTTSSAPATFGFSASTQISTVAAGASTQAIVSVAPTNGFSGPVSLSCTGPTGVTCSFSPSQLTVSPTASATSTVTIQTAATTGALVQPHTPRSIQAAQIAAAFLLPFGSILAFSRRRLSGNGNHIRLLGLLALLLVSTGIVVGCSSSSMPGAAPVTAPTPVSTGTPTGTAQVVITATSGSISQSTTIALNVQ